MVDPLVTAVAVLLAVPALWVWYDARTNSTMSPILWALTVVFGGILGILLYLLLGRDDVTRSTEQEYPFYDY